MPRQLPWKLKREKSLDITQKKHATASAAPAARQKPHLKTAAQPKKRKHSAYNGATFSSFGLMLNKGLTLDRSPSSSPPPLSIKEQFMVEGADNDDLYRMVEDEFLDVAKEFTRHLHAAEYQRLKGQAQSNNADAIDSISRPVAESVTDSVKRRQVADEIAAKQRAALVKFDDDDDGDAEIDSRWRDTSLQNLINSPRKRGSLLANLTSTLGSQSHSSAPSPSGRMASIPSNFAGSQAADRTRLTRPGSPTDSDEDDDDLGTVPIFSASVKSEPTARSSSTKGEARPGAVTCQPLSKSVARTQFSALIRSHNTEHKGTDLEDEDDDGDILATLRKRRAERGKCREAQSDTSRDNVKKSESQSVNLNEIPFF